MSEPYRLVRQYWLGDSHMKRHHGCPGAYKNIVKENPKEGTRFRQDPNLDWLQGGLQVTPLWVNQVSKLIYSNEDEPVCYVICIGTNNLRKRADKEKAKVEIIDLINYLCNVVKDVKNAALVIVSPIPDSHGYTDKLGEDLDKKLKLVTQILDHQEKLDHSKIRFGLEETSFGKNKKTFYCPFRSKQLPHNRGPTRYNPLMFKDDVHLNLAGTRALAHELFKTQGQIPNETFSFPKHAVSLEKKVRIQYPGWTVQQFDAELDHFLKSCRNANASN